MDDLEKRRQENFIKAECRYLDISKFAQGINIHKDPGNEYIMEWVSKNSRTFREMWNLSICKDCERAATCGNNLRIDCTDFKELK